MENTKLEAFHIIGINVRTTNENQQAAKDIPTLWNTFMTEDIINKIPNKVDNTIYVIYSDYESDHTKPYTTYIGCQVLSLENIPENMIAKTIMKGNYTKFTTTGDLSKGLVYDEWMKIWNTPLNRKYTTDFEVYGEKAQNPTNAEVAIYIATE